MIFLLACPQQQYEFSPRATTTTTTALSSSSDSVIDGSSNYNVSTMISCGNEWKCGENCHGKCCKNNQHQIIIDSPGNIVVRDVVNSKLDEYSKLETYTDKIKFTMDIVHLLNDKHGARFLKAVGTNVNNDKLSSWIEVPDEDARMKVRIAFRDKIKIQKPQKCNHNNNCST